MGIREREKKASEMKGGINGDGEGAKEREGGGWRSNREESKWGGKQSREKKGEGKGGGDKKVSVLAGVP